MDLIVKMVFGSDLYGTADENSDKDYKGVYIPSREDILLGRIKKNINFSTKQEIHSKNTPQDVDEEYFSIHEFIRLAVEGETIALDMLHARHTIITTSEIWEDLHNIRRFFYSKNLSAFVSYARKQAAKYGVKGSRIQEAKNFIEYLDKHPAETRLTDIWNNIPVGEHSSFVEDSKQGIKQYQIVGKIIQETTTVSYAGDIVKRYINTYGKRAKLAAKNEGIDWKAVSHALRACFQLKEIYRTGDLCFPLKQSSFLKEVKQGKINYPKVAGPLLDLLIEEVEYLAKISNYPEKIDAEVWDRYIIDVLEVWHGF